MECRRYSVDVSMSKESKESGVNQGIYICATRYRTERINRRSDGANRLS